MTLLWFGYGKIGKSPVRFADFAPLNLLLRLADWVAGLPWFPFRSRIAGNARFESGVSRHRIDSNRDEGFWVVGIASGVQGSRVR